MAFDEEVDERAREGDLGMEGGGEFFDRWEEGEFVHWDEEGVRRMPVFSNEMRRFL